MFGEIGGSGQNEGEESWLYNWLRACMVQMATVADRYSFCLHEIHLYLDPFDASHIQI